MRCRSLSGWTRTCASERLDNDHTDAATWAWIRVGRIGLAGVIGSVVWIGLLGRREQLAHPGDVMRAGAAGQQAVVANAVEAARQHVNEEAANELGNGERHRLLAIAPLAPVILPFERNGAVSERDQPAVGDGDAMGVARQIGQNGRGAAEWSLGIDDPFGLAQRREKRRECVARREIGVASNELQLAGVEGCQEFFEEETAEQPREDAYGQKEAGPAGDPAQTVRARGRPQGRSCGHGDDGSAPNPRYGEPIWRRRGRPGVWDRPRSSSAFRTTP